ncbi:squalene--hopene cyclase [Methylocapsa sp. S129]|uniref:squalene--hopene cyclase n=1 Tax=Methylocapsa sp. S129 TaxID=1641869 RepID=UPI001AED2241|nr:squalene--hopene cyclase [Methylocapsa sp. S129]
MNPSIEQTLARATTWLLGAQKPEGYWVGMVESNSCIEAQWLLCSHILGIDLPIKAGVMQALFNRQRPDGSWDIYPDAPAGDINSTVEVYAALRAMGEPMDRAELARARAWIHTHGGLKDVRVFTRYWLALIGIWPWKDIPNLPPEIVRFPLWFPFNIYNFAQWARATMVPLAVLCARRPVYPLPEAGKLEELFPNGIANLDFSIPVKKSRPWSLEALFEWIDKGLHRLQTWRLIPFRENSIKLCLEWMIRHQDADGAWGGIQPPWIYGLMALRGEGYGLNHPVVARGLAALGEHWSYERDGGTHIQASESPIWDTLFCLLAMVEAGHTLAETPAMRRALVYILDHQILEPGDWSMNVKGIACGGWAFERANVRYPDVDDTALALLVLAKLRSASGDLRGRVDFAIERALAWVFGMQCANGGWAAFDRDNDKAIISKIPFCNFGEALDPPSVDVTAHVLEALGALGMRGEHPEVAKARAFILAEQEPEGSWFGRWGVNHIYGIGAVLPGLAAIGEDMNAPYVQKAAAWLVGKQNADGGWGESCESYMDADWIGRGASTPSQTAWALMALMAAGLEPAAPPLTRGFEHLCATQRADGTWDEAHYTATGFPGYGVGARIDLRDPLLQEKLGQGSELSRGFMISFNMYRHYFPMIALARRIAG